MFRYMSFMWNPLDCEQAFAAERIAGRLMQSSAHWRCAFARPGVKVYHTTESDGSSMVRELHHDGGVILGTIFKHASDDIHRRASERAFIDVRDSSRIMASAGRNLVREYWGNYVAVICDSDCNRSRILRGPASSLPCLHVSHDRVEIFFSFMEDWVRLRERQERINWNYVAVHMVEAVQTVETGLRDVLQVQPGECVEVGHSGISRHIYWDVLETARCESIEDVTEAAAALRRTVRDCVHAWATCYDGIMLNLSGGLDSSIVLACLRTASSHPKLTCVTDYSPGPDSDERAYARLAVANGSYCKHVEHRRSSDVRLETILQAYRSAMPQNYVRRAEVARVQARLARDCHAKAILSGGGGDQLFYQNGARLTVVDYLQRHGFRAGLTRIIYDAAQLEGWSIWKVLMAALCEGLQPRPFEPLTQLLGYRTLLSVGAMDMLRSWYATKAPRTWSALHVSPGTLWHAYTLSIPADYYDPLGCQGDPEQIAPLLSQPLMELVLRIPTYVLMVGGWDRGLARRAFKDELPSEIAQRRSKGGIAEHTQEILRTNMSFVRDMLVGGLLVQHGLLDGRKVEAALAERPSGILKGMAEIVRHLSTEAWLRMWIEPTHSISGRHDEAYAPY